MCFFILPFHRSIPKGVFPSKAFHLLAEYGRLQCSQYVTDGERAGRRPSSASPGYYQLLPQDIKATTLQKPRSIWVSNSTNSNGWVVMLSQARTSRVLTSADVCSCSQGRNRKKPDGKIRKVSSLFVPYSLRQNYSTIPEVLVYRPSIPAPIGLQE